MTSLDGVRTSPTTFSETSAKTHSNRQRAGQTADDDDGHLHLLSGGPVDQIRRAYDASDEMSSAMSQFRMRLLRRDEDRGMEQSYAYLLEEDAPNKIREILGTPWISPETLTRLLHDAFPDVSDRWMALQALHSQRTTFSAAQQLALEAVIAQAEAAPPQEIRERRAGIHCAIKARLIGHAMGLEFAPAMLRAAYRNFLSTEAPDIEIYQTWIAGFGAERRAQVLQFMEGALVDDMQSADPSSTPQEFLTPLERLGILRRLRACERTFVMQVSASPLAAPFNAREADWLCFVLVILTDPLALDDAMRDVTGQAAMVHDNGAHGRLIGLLYRACSELPGEPLQRQDARDVLLESLRDMAGAAYRGERSDAAADPVSRHRRSA